MPLNNASLLLHLKSTVDNMGVQLAAQLGYAVFLDLDDIEDYTTKLQEGKEDGVVWRVTEFSPRTRCNSYMFGLLIGSAVHSDVNNTKAMETSGVISEMFPQGGKIEIYDYTQAVRPAEKSGTFCITDINLDPPVSDGMSGYRFIAITGIVIREPSV